jgi:putative ABC transport system substrate-binding protein
MMNRRTFLCGLTLGSLSAPFVAEAQQPAKTPRIGVLGVGSANGDARQFEALRQGLRDLGYVEGKSLVIEYRWAEDRRDRLPGLAAELVRLKVDLILTHSTPATRAAKQATTTIPIVTTAVIDPVGTGLVASLARPGGNITGVSLLAGEGFGGKWIELLKEVVPNLSRVAILWNPANQGNAAQVRDIQSGARALEVQTQLLEVGDPHQFDRVFAKMSAQRAAWLIVTNEFLFFAHRARIADLAAKSRLPAIFPYREAAEGGGLMSYGPDIPDMFRRTAAYIDKILRGAKPADLPIEQATKFDLVINLKAAKALGLTIPQSLLLRADEVIQ